MTTELRTVLYATDLGPNAESEYAHALRLAAVTGAALHVVHVLAAPPEGAPPVLPAPAWAAAARATWHHPVHPTVTIGLVRAILDLQPDMLVLGTARRKGFERLMHTSVAEDLTRRAGLVTLFVGAGTRPLVRIADGATLVRRVLLPVDSDQVHQQRALDVAAFVLRAFARPTAGEAEDIELVALHVGSEETFPALVTVPRAGWAWRRAMRHGPVVPAVLDCAAEVDPDLVVMATRGEDSLLDSLTGTRTEHVLRSVRCPVLAVPVGPGISRRG